jgi:hypothetical protein
VSATGLSAPRRVFHVWLRAIHHLLPPTLYFFVAFNLISFTTDLLVRNYWFHLTTFLLSTATALVVGKVVLVVDRVRLIDKFRGAPLIQPILYKTVFYSLVVLLVRLLEKIVHFALEAKGFGQAFETSVHDFTWHRFAAVHIWIFICFLIYVSATELNALLGEGQLVRLFFRHRSAEHRLTRRQHVRALMELSRLAENTPREQLLDPATPQGGRLVAIVDALRRHPAAHA